MEDNFIEFKDVYKRYQMGEVTIAAANGVNFHVKPGEFVVIVGPSGAGKSTILNMLGGIDQNDDGQIIIGGKDLSAMNNKELTLYRRYDIGFVFQFYNLIQLHLHHKYNHYNNRNLLYCLIHLLYNQSILLGN